MHEACRHRGRRAFALRGIPDGPPEHLRECAYMDVVEKSAPLCALALRADRRELCPGAECPLWEDDHCALERLTVEDVLYVDAWPDREPASSIVLGGLSSW